MSVLQRVAFAPEDGWAFVRSGDDLFLIRPPYGRPAVVDDHVLARAVAGKGFVAEPQDFPDWASLLADLQQRLIAAREAKGKRAADREEVFGLLDYAPKTILAGYLDRIESELIPGREWEPALELLRRLLRLPAVQEDAGLRDRALDVLDRCQNAALGTERERLALLDSDQALKRDFPHVAKRYQHQLDSLRHCSQAIRSRRTVFPLPAAAAA